MNMAIHAGLLVVVIATVGVLFYVLTSPKDEVITGQEQTEEETQEVVSAMEELEVEQETAEIIGHEESELITMSEARDEPFELSPISLLPLMMFTLYAGYLALTKFLTKEKQERTQCKLNLSRRQKFSVLMTSKRGKVRTVESNLGRLTELLNLVQWYITEDENSKSNSEDRTELLEFSESMLQLITAICNSKHRSVLCSEWYTYLEDLESLTSSLVAILPMQVSDEAVTNEELLQTLKTSKDELRFLITSYSPMEYLKAVSNS